MTRYTVYCAGPANDSGFQLAFNVKAQMFNQAETIVESLTGVHGPGIVAFVYDNVEKIYGTYANSTWTGDLRP